MTIWLKFGSRTSFVNMHIGCSLIWKTWENSGHLLNLSWKTRGGGKWSCTGICLSWLLWLVCDSKYQPLCFASRYLIFLFLLFYWTVGQTDLQLGKQYKFIFFLKMLLPFPALQGGVKNTVTFFKTIQPIQELFADYDQGTRVNGGCCRT